MDDPGFEIPAGARDFYLFQIVRIASGAHQASYLKDIGVLYRYGCEVNSNLHLMLSLRIRYRGQAFEFWATVYRTFCVNFIFLSVDCG